jgi:hypothetical protein
MHSLADLDSDALDLARYSAETLVRFKGYLSPGGLLLMLIGRFRDDVLDVLGAEPEPPPKRGPERCSLDELTSTELDTLSAAAGFLADRFTDFMDDPALPRLLGEFRDALNVQKEERVRVRASI